MNWRQKLANLVTREKPAYAGPTLGTGAGMVVTHDTALAHAAVWACVRIISETISTLGWQIVRELPDGSRQQVSGTTLDWLLNKQANPEMTAFSWRELALEQALIGGNHFSEIERDNQGRPIWLWPLDPQAVQPERDDSGALVYRAWSRDGGFTFLPARNVLHVHGLGWDGITGYSVIAMARRSIGMGLALDQHGSDFYANGTHLGLVLQHPKTLSDNARANLKKSIDERTGGGRGFKALIAEEGLTLAKATMTMVDAQYLESRKFQVSEICRWFRVPPHKVADLDRATFSNIESQSIEFVQDTVLPWCRRLEQEVDVKLFGKALQLNTCTRLNIDTLLRGDIMSRFTAYKMGREGGWLSPNDVRRLENQNPIAGGDEYMRPMNFVPLGTPAPVDKPAPAPVQNISLAPVINVPERKTDIVVPPSQVHVKAPVNIAGTTVNVPSTQVSIAPAQVSVAAPVVNVHPAEVNVAPAAVNVDVPAQEAPIVNVGGPNIQVDVPQSIVNVEAPVVNIAPAEVCVAAPVINVDVPAQAAPVVNIEPAVVNVAPATVQVDVPATVVNVDVPAQAAPIVNVEAPVVNVAPAPVQVLNRDTEQIIERDKQGEIRRVVTKAMKR